MQKEYGKYIVSNPSVCGGELVFRGTRMMVRDVFDYLQEGMTIDDVVIAFDGYITREAVVEAIDLAVEQLKHVHEPTRRKHHRTGKRKTATA
jgi:uncharacterized protein (DUF433 family)